ncbi:MAG: hypothetical protein QOF79_2113 [Actinomycetota bacterium]|nr:hypothetical protein [Actinomycetota bacterium]
MYDEAVDNPAWPELQEAQRSVLIDLLIHGSRSRAELARRSGLSRASLTRLTRSLIDLGLVSEGDTRPLAGRGRPSELLELRPGSAHFVGFKLTGDAVYVALTDLSASVLHSEEHALGSRDVDSVVGLMADIVASLRVAYPRISAVGVCLAGDVQISRGRTFIVGSAFLGWDEVPLAELVQIATGLPTAIANDVQSLTAAHHWFGAGVGYRSMALIGFGAGIGCGVVVNDELVDGSHGHPGRVGHLTVRSDGPLCDKGHPGCVASYVTDDAIIQNSGVEGATYADVVGLAKSGHPQSVVAFQEAAEALAVAVAHVVNLLDVEVVIVTGEGLAVVDLAGAEFESMLRRRRDPEGIDTNVVFPSFNFVDYARAAAIGAVRLVV